MRIIYGVSSRRDACSPALPRACTREPLFAHTKIFSWKRPIRSFLQGQLLGCFKFRAMKILQHRQANYPNFHPWILYGRPTNQPNTPLVACLSLIDVYAVRFFDLYGQLMHVLHSHSTCIMVCAMFPAHEPNSTFTQTLQTTPILGMKLVRWSDSSLYY